jgi:hypothetical protein
MIKLLRRSSLFDAAIHHYHTISHRHGFHLIVRHIPVVVGNSWCSRLISVRI